MCRYLQGFTMNPDARKSNSFIGTVTPWSPRKGIFSPSTQQVQPLLASTIAAARHLSYPYGSAWVTAGLLAPPRRVLPQDWTSSGKYGDLMQKFGKEGSHTGCSFGDSGVCLTGAPVLLATSVTGKDDSKGDIWRDSVLRYAGYANEIGESFRFIAPRLVVPSYAVSIAYVCGDTADKAYKELSEGRGQIAAVKMGADVLLWQLLASVGVPGLTIHLVVKALKTVMASESATRVIPQVARKWVPTAVGLGIIPLIIHPIDDAVTLAMDSTVRRWM